METKEPGKGIPGIGKGKSSQWNFMIIIFYYNLIGIKYLITSIELSFAKFVSRFYNQWGEVMMLEYVRLKNFVIESPLFLPVKFFY